MSTVNDFPLGIGRFQFSDLYRPERLQQLHGLFWDYAEQNTQGIRARFTAMADMSRPQQSETLIETARILGDFVGRLFNVSTHEALIKKATLETAAVFRFKKEFLNIRVFKRLEEPPITPQAFKELDRRVRAILGNEPGSTGADEELATAQKVLFILDCETRLKANKPLDTLENQRLQSLC